MVSESANILVVLWEDGINIKGMILSVMKLLEVVDLYEPLLVDLPATNILGLRQTSCSCAPMYVKKTQHMS